MQMTPHEPQEAVRLDKRRLCERHGTPGRARIGPDRALQVSQATGTSLEVRLILQNLHFAWCKAMSARQGIANRVAPASCVRSGEEGRHIGIEGPEQTDTAP